MGKKISFPLVIFERRKAEELRACWKRHLSIDMQVSGDVCHSAQKTLKHFGKEEAEAILMQTVCFWYPGSRKKRQILLRLKNLNWDYLK